MPRSSTPTPSNKRSRLWSEEDDAQLIDGRNQNESFPTISARRFSGARSHKACFQRYKKLNKADQGAKRLGVNPKRLYVHSGGQYRHESPMTKSLSLVFATTNSRAPSSPG